MVANVARLSADFISGPLGLEVIPACVFQYGYERERLDADAVANAERQLESSATSA
jgi:hypothetical protein